MARASATTRLVALIDKIHVFAGNSGDAETFRAFVAHTLGLKKVSIVRQHEVYARLVALTELAIEEVELCFADPDLTDEERKAAVATASAPVRAFLDILAANSINTRIRTFASPQIAELRLLAISVRQRMGEDDASPDSIAEMIQAVATVEETVRSSTLHPVVKARLLTLLRRVRWSLEEYPHLGPDGALAALGGLVGFAVAARNDSSANANPDVWEQLSRLVNLVSVLGWGYFGGPVVLKGVEQLLLK